MTRSAPSVIALIAGGLSLVGSPGTVTAEVAAWISSSMPEGCEAVRRSDRPLPGVTLLRAGDVVHVPQACTVVVMVDESSREILTAASSPHVVKARPSRRGFLSALRDWLGLPLDDFIRQRDRRLRQVVVRVDGSAASGAEQGQLAARMLSGGVQAIVVGEERRAIQLPRDGRGLETYLAGESCITGAEGSETWLECGRQGTGSVEGLLFGAPTTTGRTWFLVQVMAREEALEVCRPVGDALSADASGPMTRNYELVVTLIEQCGRSWKLQGYQLLAPYLGRDRMAEKLATAIAVW